MNQEDERKSPEDNQMITNRITKLREEIKEKQVELERLERFIFLNQEP